MIPESNIPLFKSEKIIKAALIAKRFPSRITETVETKQISNEPLYAKLVFEDFSSFPVELKIRGQSRANYPVPPLKIIFSKNIKFENSILKTMQDDELKLVTAGFPPYSHNRPSKSSWVIPPDGTVYSDDDLTIRRVIQEYVIYTLISQTGSFHFKTRLVDLSYIYEEGGLFIQSKAFFIEPNKDMASRFGFERLKKDARAGASIPVTDPRAAYLHLTELLVLNQDYTLDGFNNIIPVTAFSELFNLKDLFGFAPYDFDRSEYILPKDDFVNDFASSKQAQDFFKSALTTLFLNPDIYSAFKAHSGFSLPPIGKIKEYSWTSLEQKETWQKSVLESAKQILCHGPFIMRKLFQSPLNFEEKSRYSRGFFNYFKSLRQFLIETNQLKRQ